MAQDQDKSKHRSSGSTAHVDYAGSQAKTDPEEIRLVRKLDACIMVSGYNRQTTTAVGFQAFGYQIRVNTH